jgi:peptidoglycan/xylan/chitin deacetylase (PgdA/CDA1 family)
VPILTYHRIIPTSEAGDSRPDLVVAPATFSAQLKALFDAGWHSITMAELADEMEADRPVATKTFVITIDDGWSDGYDYAFPIMRRYGYVGTFYMVAGRIDHTRSLTTQEMRTLEAAGNEIGNHTEHHVSLSMVPLSRVEHEVEDASRQIARAVGHRPVSLAYPMGGVSNPVVMVVSQIPDIKIAVTTQRGKTETWLGRYEVPRVPVRPDTDPARLLASLSSQELDVPQG